MTDSDLWAAFRYGQALAAWNCGFKGARGGMYSTDKARFFEYVQGILNGDGEQEHASHPHQGTTRRPWRSLSRLRKDRLGPVSERHHRVKRLDSRPPSILNSSRGGDAVHRSGIIAMMIRLAWGGLGLDDGI